MFLRCDERSRHFIIIKSSFLYKVDILRKNKILFVEVTIYLLNCLIIQIIKKCFQRIIILKTHLSNNMGTHLNSRATHLNSRATPLNSRAILLNSKVTLLSK